jgi:hypothetical protein
MAVRDRRRQQTLYEADRLHDEVDRWVDHRIANDQDATGYRGRYQTQLDAISSEVTGAVGKVREMAAGDVAMRPFGDVFSDYNLHDQRLVWIRYAWSYFRDKLDQRDDSNLRGPLEAADEVSCLLQHLLPPGGDSSARSPHSVCRIRLRAQRAAHESGARAQSQARRGRWTAEGVFRVLAGAPASPASRHSDVTVVAVAHRARGRTLATG